MTYTSRDVPRRTFLRGMLAGGIGALIGVPAITARADAAGAAAIRLAASVGPLINIPQTWNNCGPCSVAEVLAYWGITRTQAQVQAVLRADGDPTGMGPYGVPAYMRSLGMRALLGADGSERVVQALISNGFPVIVDQYVSLGDRTGHYRPIQAYDDQRRIFVSSDPYLGQDHVIGYDEFDAIWQSSNRRFMVLYPPARQVLLDAVLATAGWHRAAAARQDLARMQGLLASGYVDYSEDESPNGYYLAIAWDQLQLGRYAASRQAIQQARRRGASPIVANWIGVEVALAARA